MQQETEHTWKISLFPGGRKERGAAWNSGHQYGGMVLHGIYHRHLLLTETPVPRQMPWVLLSAQTKLGRKVADVAESLHGLVQSTALKLHLLETLLVLQFLVTVPFLNPLHTKKALGRGILHCFCRYTELKACHNDEAHDLQPDTATCLSSLCYHNASMAKDQRLGSILLLHHMKSVKCYCWNSFQFLLIKKMN